MSQPEDRKAAGTFPAAIVWDLDGTLAESAPDLCTALNTLLKENGLPQHSVTNVRNMIGGGVPKLIERGFRASGSPLDNAGIEALVPRFMAVYSACATDNTHLRPHAREALEHFHQAGIIQGLCTNKPISVTRQIVAALGVEMYFGSVIGGDSTKRRKPDPLPLQTCLAELGVLPSRALMVGDSGADVGAAKATGVAIFVVPDGYTSAAADSLGADLVLTSLAEVFESTKSFFPA